VTKRVPLLPTLVVAAAVAMMIGLGVWQLQRLQWKEALLARYHLAQAMNSDVPWPRDKAAMQRSLFRWSRLTCERVLGMRGTAATSIKGESGMAWIADCEIDDGGRAEVALGWARPPREYSWSGGEVSGTIGPGGKYGGILYAAQTPPELERLTPPDPASVPNNHLSYAIQWFFFALTATVIYVLALRKRWREAGR
jgi:surfeit locus 1 family protein